MKKLFLSIILYIERFGMSFVYFFIKFFPIQKNKIIMLSRQSNDINIDFKMLLDEFSNQDKNIKVKTVEAGQKINIEKNLFFDVLWPNRRKYDF